MSDTKNVVFISLQVIVWIVFVGLSIEAGALIVNFIYSFFNPGVLGNLYLKLDLRKLYQQSQAVFFGLYGFVLFISVLKASLFYEVIRLLQKLDLAKPFSSFVSSKIFQLSYFTFSIGIMSYIARGIAKNMAKQQYDIDKLAQFWADSQAFILMAAVVYVIAVIFKKGVDLQNENDLTV